jgi:deoxycytidine triphosphate deaminase
MSFLTRSEIVDKITNGNMSINIGQSDLLYKNFAGQAYSIENPLQQCSIDFHVGEIYLPEKKPNRKGGAINPLTDSYVLPTGGTILIRTKESIKLSDKIAGICFSPSNLAMQAILLINTGHIDPGYEGKLHFTAINMGKSGFTFRTDDTICTALFFELANSEQAYGAEKIDKLKVAGKEENVPHVIKEYFPKLAKDFVNVEKRSKSIVNKRIVSALLIQVGLPVVVALFIILPNLISKPWESQISAEKSRIDKIEAIQQYGITKNQLKIFQDSLKVLSNEIISLKKKIK